MAERPWHPLFTGISEDLVKSILAARRARSGIGEGLFSDPAWDIMLELYAAELGQRIVLTAQIRTTLDVSDSIAERWLDALEQRGLVTKNPSAFGQQIILSSAGSAAMQRYFADIVTSTVPL